MGSETDIRVPALIVVLSLLAPLTAEAGYRFEDGVYLGSAELLADWSDTLARAQEQHSEVEACLADLDLCPARMRGLHTVMARAPELSRERQIRLIHRYVNKRNYRNDRGGEVTSNLTDQPVRLRSRWSTLAEFMHRGGNCQDYATSKYQLLRLLGMPAEDLRVVVVFDRATRTHHAVLAARLEDGAIWLLDSDDTIYRSRPFGYRFVYALNESSIWDHEADPSSSPLAHSEEPS
jgi:predicted transglutaminase-like cysteine proteinase